MHHYEIPQKIKHNFLKKRNLKQLLTFSSKDFDKMNKTQKFSHSGHSFLKV